MQATHSRRLVRSLPLILLAFGTLAAGAVPRPQESPEAARRAELEQRFAKLLSGARLVGHTTLDGVPQDDFEDTLLTLFLLPATLHALAPPRRSTPELEEATT